MWALKKNELRFKSRAALKNAVDTCIPENSYTSAPAETPHPHLVAFDLDGMTTACLLPNWICRSTLYQYLRLLTFSTVTCRLHLVARNVYTSNCSRNEGRYYWGFERQGSHAVKYVVSDWSTKLQSSQQGKGVIGVKSGEQVLKIFPTALRVLQAIHAGKYPGPMRLAIASSAVTPEAVHIAKAAMALLEIVPGTLCRLL